ncbi:MAG TPA: hypothetical protein VFO10_26895 [Oligoflexus sp.]|uniref:hypothetical protein n=1 Tax=Oligoflexus sp. TaxID=1971216 RepID=UPI002D7E8179|nr:hypothetical protein [Oligoflexus sp.]HET9240922.1 hypothetical protein [Oligoflexus sp.]
MVDLAADRRIVDFMDKWRRVFRSDAELLEKNPTTESFFTEAEMLKTFLSERGGSRSLAYALRVMAHIPGLTQGLKQTFARECN